MTDMREWWANVYPEADGPNKIGYKCASKKQAERIRGEWARFRIYVRLKPEGAPKRYRDGYERWIWEKGIGAGAPP